MSDWVNWQQFADAQKPEQQRQAQEMEARAASEQAIMDRALNGLEQRGLGQARAGQFDDLRKVSGYSELMASRDAALQAQTPRQQVAPWESELGGKQYESPWASLSKRLGSANNKLDRRNAQTLNQQTYDRQMEDQRRFNEEQKRKLDEAINGKRNKEAADYAAWSDSVKYAGQRGRGSGGSAYLDAQNGTGPKPVSAGYGPRVTKMQGRLRENDKNQLMPPTTDSNFGQSTSGF